MYYTSHLFICNVLLYNNYNSCNLSSSQWLPTKKKVILSDFKVPGSGNIRSDYGNQTIQTPDANNGQLTLLKIIFKK